MSLRILFNSNESRLEAEISGETYENSLLKSDTLVNPTWCNVVGKTIIINRLIPIKFNPKLNNIISRIPLDIPKYNLGPYKITTRLHRNRTNTPVSKYILNKWIMESNIIYVSEDEKYLLGSDISKDNYLTLTGYMIY